MPSPQTPPFIKTLLLTTTLTAVIALADFSTPRDLSLSVFYLVPVILAGWRGGIVWGLAFSFIAVGLDLAVGLTVGYPQSAPIYYYFALFSNFATFAITSFIVKRWRESYLRERELSHTDPLTGLFNRSAFIERFEVEISRQSRNRTPLSVIYLDFDNFKAINDKFGHAVGDRALRICARLLSDNLRRTDVIGRLGGDELAIVLPETGALESASIVAALRDKLAREIAGHQWEVSFSAGNAVFLTPPASVDAALQAADRLMYLVKQHGKCGFEQEVID